MAITERCPTCLKSEATADGCPDAWHRQFRVNQSGPGENTRLQKWVDPAMYVAEPVSASGPQVFLLEATPDPLGSIAAAAALYEGRVHRRKGDVADDERRRYLEEMQNTKIKAPLEFVQFHFLLEGVTRGFTHQLVRQRTATFVQESTRFAVKEDMPVGRPPSLANVVEDSQGLYPDSQPGQWAAAWDGALEEIGQTYQYLVNTGMPAEDARGLLPTNLLTRVHYSTDLRALLDHAGNRLCTQAQFEWRIVFAEMVKGIRKNSSCAGHATDYESVACRLCDNWQWKAIAGLLQPVCYQTGQCAFASTLDRSCSIRHRVQANYERGRPASQWGEELDEVTGNPVVAGVGAASVVRDEQHRPVFIGAIQPREWLADPGAAR